MKLKRLLLAGLGLLLVGCSQPDAPAQAPLDFTRPGVAKQMLENLVEQAGSNQLIMAEVRHHEVTVSVLREQQAVTWAYRDKKIAQVQSDLEYVDQATFNLSAFKLDDVGALFRAAASGSGSQEKQSLQIVDYSGGHVMMSVSTNPESRTIFFTPEGALFEELNFDTAGGIERGMTELSRGLRQIVAVNIDSARGIWIDYLGNADDTVVRLQRAPAVPVTTTIRTEETDELLPFDPKLISLKTVWEVANSKASQAGAQWSVTITQPLDSHSPRMTFDLAGTTFVTDLLGNNIEG